MVVSFRSASEDARGTTGKPIPAPPTGTTSGDLLLAIQTCDVNGSLVTMTAPSGWTERGSWTGTTGAGFMKVWTRAATSSEPATYAFSDDTDSHGSVIILALFEHEPATPLAVLPVFSVNTATTAHAAPSVTAVAGGLLVTAYLAGTDGASVSYTPPNGMTERRESRLTSSPNICTMAATTLLVDTSATGLRTATCSSPMPFLATTMVVAPAGWTPPSTDPPQSIEPVGIATGGAFGTPAVNQGVLVVGISTAQAFGTPTVAVPDLIDEFPGTYPGAIYPGETAPGVAEPAVEQVVATIGISSGQAFGIPAVVGGAVPTAPETYPGATTFPGLSTFPSTSASSGQSVTAIGISSAETVGIPNVTGDPAGPQTVVAIGIDTAETVGEPWIQVAVGLYADDQLYPSDDLYPLDGDAPISALLVRPAGIGSALNFGEPLLQGGDGPQAARTTAIDSGEAFGRPTVGASAPDEDIAPESIESDERFGRPRIQREVPPPVVIGPYFDTYFLDGIDLSTYAVQIEVAEGLQETPGVIGDNIALPGRDGALEVYGSYGQPRRTDGIGRITFSLWMIGVDPDTGEIPDGSFSAEQYFQRWDELVRLVHRRRVTIDHPRPDGTRRAIGHLMPGETIAPSSRSSSPWFGRMKVTFAIPGAHWTELDTVTTGAQSLTSGGALSLAAFAASTAPCTDLTVRFGAGNNPRLSTSYNHVGWNGVIAPGFELGIDTTFGETHQASGAVWTPGYSGLTYSPGPRLFEVDPAESLSAVLSHTTGGSMLVEVSGRRRYRTS